MLAYIASVSANFIPAFVVWDLAFLMSSSPESSAAETDDGAIIFYVNLQNN